MLNHLKEKKDVGFFTSIAGLMNSCSVLDLDAFERNTKAEGEQIVIGIVFYNRKYQICRMLQKNKWEWFSYTNNSVDLCV